MEADGTTLRQNVEVTIDPDYPDPSWIAFEEEAERIEAELSAQAEEGEEVPVETEGGIH